MEHDLSIIGALRHDLSEMIAEESILEARIAMVNAPVDAKTAQSALSEAEIKIPDPTPSRLSSMCR